MFGLDWSELMIVAVVAIVVVGPKELPKALRGLGKVARQLQSMAGEFRSQFNEAMKEAELAEITDLAKDVKNLDPSAELRKSVNDSFSSLSSVSKSLNDTGKSIELAIRIDPAAATHPPAIASGGAVASVAVANAAGAATTALAYDGSASVSVIDPKAMMEPLATTAPANDVAVESAVADGHLNGSAAGEENVNLAKRGVAQRAAEAWKKAAGDA